MRQPLLAALSLLATVLAAVPHLSRAQPLNPPVLVQLQTPGIAYLPDGARIALPAGSELDNCPADGTVVVYDPFARVQPVLSCAERPIFRDGFE